MTLATVFTSPDARALSATWLAGTSGNWTGTANWLNTSNVHLPPGIPSINTPGSGTSADVAFFYGTAASGGSTVTVNQEYNAASLQFDGSAFNGANGYTVNASSGGYLALTNGNATIINGSFAGAGITETISAPLLVLTPASNGVGGYYFGNYTLPSANNTLSITGGVAAQGVQASLAGTLTSGANAVTGVSNTVDLSTGLAVSGSGIPTGDTISALTTNVYTGSIASGSNQITNLSSTANLAVGQLIAGTGIPAGSTITNISGSTITISNNATATSASFSGTYTTGFTLVNSATSSSAGASLTAVSQFAATGNTTANSTSITGVAYSANLVAGQVIYGAGIPGGDTIGSLNNSSFTPSTAYLSGATTITLTSAANLAVGQLIAGTGIPTGTVITAINGTTITLSAATTAGGSAAVSVRTSITLAYAATASATGDSLTTEPLETTYIGGFSNVSVTGALSDGTNAALGLTQYDTGTVTLSGTNTYSGPTTLSGGTLVVNYIGSNTGAGIGSGTNVLLLGMPVPSGVYVGEGGSILELNGNSTLATTQAVSNLNVDLGASAIQLNPGGGQAEEFLDTGTLGRALGGTLDVDFNGPNTSFVVGNTSGIATSGIGSNAILIGVTVGGTTWAAISSGSLQAYSGGFVNTWTSGSNTMVSSSSPLTGISGTTNSLLFNQAASNTVSVVTGGTAKIASGEILVTSGVGANNTLITGGTLASGNSTNELIVDQNDTTGTLTIASNLGGSTALTKSGPGTLVLSGSNTNTGQLSIDSGIVQLGSNTALNGSSLFLAGYNAELNLNGFSGTLSLITTTDVGVPGTVLGTAGVQAVIANTAAGTQSNFTLDGAGRSVISGASLLEGPGAVLGFTVAAGVLEYGNTTGVGAGGGLSGEDTPGLGTTYISGPIVLSGTGVLNNGGNDGQNGSLVTTGAFVISGNASFGPNPNGGTVAGSGNGLLTTTYLGATGGFLNLGHNNGIFVNTTSSLADNATGLSAESGAILSFGTGILQLSAFNVTNGGNGLMDAAGESTLITPGLTGTSSYGLTVDGLADLVVTGTSGIVTGAGLSALGVYVYGGTLDIAPAGTGQNVTVTGLTLNTNAALNFGGGGTLELNSGGNTSVTLQLGTVADTTYQMFKRQNAGTLVVEAAQGLGALGSTDVLQVLAGNSTELPPVTNGILAPYLVASDTNSNGTFLGVTTTATSATLVQATYTDTDFSTPGATQIETVAGGSTATLGSGSTTRAYALQDNGTVSIAGTGTLELGNGGSSTQAGLILNGGSISGGVLTAGSGELLVYTSTAGGTISSTISGGAGNTYGLTIFGPGVLSLTGTLGYSGVTTIDSGVLDIASATGGSGMGTLPSGNGLALEGGVLQTSGTFTDSLYTGNNSLAVPGGQVAWIWQANQEGEGGSGGFSARGAELTVAIGGTASPTQLVWGNYTGPTNGVVPAGFVSPNGVLMFGSVTSNNEVNFENPISLGAYVDQFASSQSFEYNDTYDRIVSVAANAGDNFSGGLPTTLGGSGTGSFAGDYTVLSGVISGSLSNDLVKAGNGILELTGQNTYTGATSITSGILAVSQDSNLGIAPSAAYPLVVTPGYSGYTLTQGAVQIDGGILAWMGTGTLNANRTVLLGPVAGIDVTAGNTMTFNGQIANYINETGNLTKTDRGELILGGINSYTGTTTVSGGILEATETAALPGVNTAGMIVTGSGGTLAVQTGGASGWTSANIDTLRQNATFNAGSSLGIDTTNGNFNYSSNVSGVQGLTKLGANALTLSGSNSYSGATLVSAGSLLVAANGSLSNTSVTVAGGATLGAGGAASGGSSLSALNLVSLTLSTSSTMSLYLNPSGTSDTISATTLNVNGSEIVLSLTPTSLSSLTGASYTLLTWSNTSVSGIAGDFSVNFNGTGGLPAGYTLQEVNGSTDSLDLVASAVPEPSVRMMFGLGLAVILFGWCRKTGRRAHP